MSGSHAVEGGAASKFFPPRIDAERHLIRSSLVEQIRSRGLEAKKVILIQAQAGQGKSVFTAQLLSHLEAPFAWYQMGPEDGDPVLLLSSLLTCLCRSLPGFSSPTLEEMLTSGVISALEAPGCIDLLAKDLDRLLRKDFFLVFDDVYLVEKSPSSLALLNRLIQGAPRRLRPVLISRPPILPMLELGLPPEQMLMVGNEELALSHREIAALFNDVLRLPVAIETVQSLHAATEGWIMGLLLAANAPLSLGLPESSERLESFLAKDHGSALDYFVAEVLSALPEGLRRTLAKLSLLQQVPVDLARKLAEVEGVEAVLEELEQRNFFVRRLNEERSVFTFHHLFQDCLRAVLEKEFTRVEIEQALNCAADWYLGNEQPEDALRFYVKGHHFEAAQRVLRQFGMALQAQNRIVTLADALASIDADVMRQLPWLGYFYGIVLINTDPPEALPWFEATLEEFRRSVDELGELMALVQEIHFHIAVDGIFNRCRPLFERATVLFDTLAEQLELSQRANAANVFLLAFSIVDTDLEKADRYFNLGLNWAQEAGLENLEAEARMARCYRHIFAADYRACRQEIERSLGLLGSPRVSAINKGAFHLAHLNLLVNEGDFRSYRHHKTLLRERLGEEVVDRSVFGAFIRLWDVDLDLAQGHFDKARDRLRQSLGDDYCGSGPHLRNQYLQYQAYLWALDGEVERALEAASEALALREEIGGPTFEMINAAIIGATFAKLGLHQKARKLFEQGLTLSKDIGEELMRPSLYAFRAKLSLRIGDDGVAHDDIRQMLGLLGKRDNPHFYAWTPNLMTGLLTEAVRNDIEVDQARKLAKEKLGLAILDDGSPIPLLKIHTLGRFEVEIDDSNVLRAADLSTAQRQLLALLLAAPQQQLHQEEAQAALWPESSPQKARSSFDNLVSRLRKTLDKALGSLSVKYYLTLQHGVLRLENCRFDFVDFIAKARQGLAHVRKKEFWQADNALRRADELWQGEFLPGIPLDERAEPRRHDLHLLYLESAQRWCEILCDIDQEADAIRVINKALGQDPVNEPLVRLLYDLHARQGSHVQSRRVLSQYAEALKGMGFSTDEVEDILDSFWSPAT